MPQLGKLWGTVLDNNGNPISGASVEVRRQGAFVTSTQAGPGYTVNDPGGIVVGDQVRPNALTGPSRNVSAVTATSITTSGPGLGTMNDEDRISVYSALPTLYNDAQGAEVRSNPLTTDANGFWFCWATIVPYDLIESATGYATRLKTDQLPEGQESVQSNIFTGAAIIAWLKATVRTLTGGYLFDFQNPAGVTKIRGGYDGSLELAGNLTAVNGTFSGNVSVTGDLTVDDITADDISCQDAAVTGTFNYSGTTGGFGVTAGSIETADLANNATMATSVGTGTTDLALVAGAAYAAIPGCSVTATPFSTSSEFIIQAVIPVQTDAVAGDMSVQIKEGATVIHEAKAVQAFAGARYVTIPLIARQTGVSVIPHTWTVEAKCTVAATIYSNSTALKARLMVMEFKK